MRFPAGRLALVTVVTAVACSAFAAYRYSAPLPALTATTLLPESAVPLSETVAIPWSRNGAAAIAVDRLGVIGASGDDRMRPIASVAKLMTTHVVLKAHPLRPGEPGPEVRVTADDVRNYNRHVALDNSVVLVAEGRSLTQYDLLQALLIASGNNIADLLARWDAGSSEAFVAKMNAEAAALGMTKTRYVDPNGTSPHSLSTAGDQLILIQSLMTNPVFAEIVAKRQAQIPVAGTIATTNQSLGRAGIVGGKTGWTEEAGGNLVFVAKTTVDGRPVTFFGAVIGESDRPSSFATSERLASAVASGLRFVKLLSSGTAVLDVHGAWGASMRAVLGGDAEALAWPGVMLQTRVEPALPTRLPIAAGAALGSVTLTYGSQKATLPLRAEQPLSAPNLGWRVLR